MAVLLIGEVTDGHLAVDATAKALTAARKLGEVTVLCAGAHASDAARSAAKLDGVAKVLCAEDPSLGHRLAEPTAALIVSLAGDYDHIVAPATTDAQNARRCSRRRCRRRPRSPSRRAARRSGTLLAAWS